MKLASKNKVIDSINYLEKNASYKLGINIKKHKEQFLYSHWIIVCIGTDRSTGDSLGPIIGSTLKSLNLPNCLVLGTLEEPVHAVNLEETIDKIKTSHPSSGVIAVDSCLGRSSSVGKIQIVDGPLKPGSGVKKELPTVGDFNVVGIVNIGGFMEYMVLQNTRLNIIMKMSKVISNSLYISMR